MEKYGKVNEGFLSEFIVITCQVLPKWIPVVSDYMRDITVCKERKSKDYSIRCGSSAEFYIRPLNTCIGDVDFLVATADELVFSGDIPAFPSDLSVLSDTICCHKIEPYDSFPGFVRLLIWGKMIYNWRDKKYDIDCAPVRQKMGYMKMNMDTFSTSLSRSASVERIIPNTASGPAITLRRKTDLHEASDLLKSDFVASLWCPQWPKEAQCWLNRHRKYGIPTIDTINQVVENGCHVVYVQHRSCRDDKEQWRFSFSVAEVILLRSWTKTQQIVYHLLRFFAKKELIQKDCSKDDEVLCTYHLKTLMLWTCEEMSPEWWNANSVIAICSKLLRKLFKWLKGKCCPNYFIPAANLFHESLCPRMLEETERRLDNFQNSEILGQWFMENYIMPFMLIDGTVDKTKEQLADYLFPLFELRKAKQLGELDVLFGCSFTCCHKYNRNMLNTGRSLGLSPNLQSGNVSMSQIVPTSTSSDILTEVPTIENVSCFTCYDIQLYSLHIAYALHCRDISWNSSLLAEFVQTVSMQLKIVRCRYRNYPNAGKAHCSRYQFQRAEDLMQNLTGSNISAESKLISLLSKEYLRKALVYERSQREGITNAAKAYLAALHFATSEYQQATLLCSQVLRDQTSKQANETLNAGCLLFIDDVVRIVGLCVLHKRIVGRNPHYINNRLCLDLRLSPEIFAYYLTVCLADLISEDLDCYIEDSVSELPMDKYLRTLSKPKCAAVMKACTRVNAHRQRCYCRTDSVTATVASGVNALVCKDTNEALIDVLMEYAVEHMTSFYKLFRQDFGIECNTADCYRALYLYKYLQYDEVLRLCEQILLEPDLRNDLKEFPMTNVLLIPPLDSFFDRDVQALLGVHTLFHHLSAVNGFGEECELTEHWLSFDVDGPTNELVSFLPRPYCMKRHYFIGRHFLARYLSLRCCIDSQLPHAVALSDFVAHEAGLPFEQVIKTFLLQKLCDINV